VSLPPATILSVSIYDFVEENKELARVDMDTYFPCCGKSICRGCLYSLYSFQGFDNDDKCPFCNSNQGNKTEEEDVEDLMKRVEANDAASICLLGNHHEHGLTGLQQDWTKAMELYARAADLGCSKAHCYLGNIHYPADIKKAKFHYEAAAMAGHEVARFNLGIIEADYGNMERAVKHWTVAASAGYHKAMHNLQLEFVKGLVSRESIDSTLEAYNSSCAEMRSEARDAHIKVVIEIG
jgi:predicted NUDIX family NTP pyrophosphohydrolase